MPLLKEADQAKVREVLGQMAGSVQMHLFTQENECQTCAVTHELADDVAALSDKVTLHVHDFVQDAELAKTMGVDKIPAIVLDAGQGTRVRFFGIPSGYEFSGFIEDLIEVSQPSIELPPNVAKLVARIDKPVHLQVMITPT